MSLMFQLWNKKEMNGKKESRWKLSMFYKNNFYFRVTELPNNDGMKR